MALFRALVKLTLISFSALLLMPELCDAAGKKAPAPKKAAPKVQHHHNPGPKPNRVVHHSPNHPDHVAKKVEKPKAPEKGKEPPKVMKPEEKGKEPAKVIRPEEKGKEPLKVVRPEEKGKEPARVLRPVKPEIVHRFARFNERTGEWAFDTRWWYSFVVYPSTVGRYQESVVDYETIVPPTNVTVTPPVIKAGQGLPMSAAGTALAARLDALDVENHWLTGQQVSWKTGNALNDAKGPASNGGAFVAAVCARFKVAMIPTGPDHFLPASQHDWLLGDGLSEGWVRVGDTEAQLLANQGWVVVAAWKTGASGDRSLAGQTAIVRPSGKPAAEVGKRGPQVTLAGTKNYNDIALKDSFPAKAWNEVVYVAFRPHY